MNVIFKSISNKSYNFLVNNNDKISDVVNQLVKILNINLIKSHIQVIFQGKFIEHTMSFSEIKNLKHVFVFIVSKNKLDNNSDQSHLIKTIPTINKSLFDQDTYKNSLEQLDEVDKLRASVISVLSFIHSNPQLAELFINNFESLIGVFSSNQVKPLFEKIISDDIDDEINDNNFIDELTDSLANIKNSLIFN